MPKRSWGRTRIWTVTDYIVETVVYGGGGALLGAGLAFLIVTRIPIPYRPTRLIIAAFTLIGFLIGAIGGERGINWVGHQLREHHRA